MKKIYIQSEGKALGPSSIEEVRSLVTAGWLAKSNPAQYEGDTVWQPLSEMPEFSDSAPASPVEPPPQPMAPELPPARRAPLKLAPIFRIAFRVLLLLILVGLIAAGGLYIARHGAEFLKTTRAIGGSRGSAVTNATSVKSVKSVKTAINAAAPAAATAAQVVPVPAQRGPFVELAAAPTNTAPAAWERASQPNVPSPSPGLSLTPATNAPANAAERRASVSNVDPKSTPFGEYDVLVIKAVQKRWFTLMDQNPRLHQRSGRVVVSFQLSRNGAVSNVKVRESSGDAMEEYLCQQAVNDSKPFPRWPASAIGAPSAASENDARELRFTFQY